MSGTPTFSTIEVGASGPVGRLTLARPERLNALSAMMMEELVEAADWFGTREAVRTIVVSGKGRAFCAGFDLEDAASLLDDGAGDETRRAGAQLGSRMADAIEGIPQVSVAALHGHVVGGGVVLAAACDLRIAAADTIFSIPEVDMGIPLAWGGIPRLVREIGPARTKELVLTCRRFRAPEALAMGFLNRVVPASDVEAAATELATTIAAKPPIPVKRTKRQVNAAAKGDLQDLALDDVAGVLEALGAEDAGAAMGDYIRGVKGK